MSKTFVSKPSEITRKWHLIDATGVPLGRLSTQIANLLVGKHKPSFTPHVDGGDFVVVINAALVKITGKKSDQKLYYRHTGFPGGIKSESLSKKISTNPQSVIETSVKGMISANKLRPLRLKRLKVFADSEHTHSAQKPQPYNVEKDVK